MLFSVRAQTSLASKRDHGKRGRLCGTRILRVRHGRDARATFFNEGDNH